MLVRLLYASRSTAPITPELTDAILEAAQSHNAEHGITGVLCICSQANVFLQALEGGRAQINALYNRLVQDPRHTDVVLLHYEQIDQRVFSSWRMGRVDLNRVNTGTILRYSSHSVVDPFSMSGTAAIAMVMELASTTTVISRPGTAR
jgi:hypothetical protein